MKKRQPGPINPQAFMLVIQGFKPLTDDDKASLFKQTIKALNSMQFGINLTTSDFTTLCDMLNISLLLAEDGIGAEYKAELHLAREGMQDAKQRYIKTKKLGFTATELSAVKVALSIHSAQIDLCSMGEFTRAFNEQKNRISKGNFYHRDGDLRRVAA